VVYFESINSPPQAEEAGGGDQALTKGAGRQQHSGGAGLRSLLGTGDGRVLLWEHETWKKWRAQQFFGGRPRCKNLDDALESGDPRWRDVL